MRITEKDLGSVCERINRTLRTDAYYLDGAYGGWALYKQEETGGASDVFRVGHVSKPDLYHQMHAFLTGIEALDKHLGACVTS